MIGMTGREKRMAIRGWTAWGLLALAGAACAGEAPRPLCESIPVEHWIFNPAGDRDVRLAELAGHEARFSELAPDQKRWLASLYWHGEKHPAALVVRDVEKARRWFAESAVDGDLMAMASSAELELADGDAFAGMMWAQIFVLHLRSWKPKGTTPETYPADLMQRAFRTLPRGRYSTEQIDDTLNAFMDKYGARIEAGRQRQLAAEADAKGDRPSCEQPALAYPTEARSRRGQVSRASPSGEYPRVPGWATFHVRINSDGKVTHAFVMETLPGPSFGPEFVRTIRKLAFNSVDPSAPPRDVVVPLLSMSIYGPRFTD